MPHDVEQLAAAQGLAAAAEDMRVQLRERKAFGRCSSLSDAQLGDVLEHVGGRRWLAVEALAMRPWPTWMRAVLFPRR